MKVAIGYSTYNKTELSSKSMPRILEGDHAFFWADGSNTSEALDFYEKHIPLTTECYPGIKGGSGAAIVFLLTKMLNHPAAYTHVGLVEADVVLEPGWVKPTLDLFERGEADGLKVGAVSARCYEDRILIQRNGYAVMHNLGAGMIVFTREAAELILDQYRVQKTTENRTIFSQLSGIEIAKYWAFRGSEHFLVADWRWDALLASKGFASLAVTPSMVEMIGQTPPLEQQGLRLVDEPMGVFDLPKVFDRYRESLQAIRDGEMTLPDTKFFTEQAMTTIFPHQVATFNGLYEGEWKLVDSPGYGPFAWKGSRDSSLTIKIFGPCEVFVGGGGEGSQVRIVDQLSGFDISPTLAPEGPNTQVMTVSVPGSMGYRNIKVTTMMDGLNFYGIRTRDSQPMRPAKFDYSVLPPT